MQSHANSQMKSEASETSYSTDTEERQDPSPQVKLIEQLLRRGLDAGFENFFRNDSILRNLITDRKVIAEISRLVMAQVQGQIRQLRDGMTDIIAKEIQNALADMTIEVKADIKLKPKKKAGGDEELNR